MRGMRYLLLMLPLIACGPMSGGALVPVDVEIVNLGSRVYFELSGDVDGDEITGVQYLSQGESITHHLKEGVGATVGLGVTFKGQPNGEVHFVAEAQKVGPMGLLITATRAADGTATFEYR